MMERTQPTFETLQPPSRMRWLWPVLFLVLAALGFMVVRNLLPRSASQADVDWTRDMTGHHQQAVEMATILRDRLDPEDEQLRLFLLDMMLTQQAQIGQMQGWLTVWGEPLAGEDPIMGGMGQEMGMASQEQVNSLKSLPLDEAEVQFFQLMIRHHQGAVHMSEDILQGNPRPEVARLAESILAAQQSEIDYMTELLHERGAEPLAPLEPMDMDHSSH